MPKEQKYFPNKLLGSRYFRKNGSDILVENFKKYANKSVVQRTLTQKDLNMAFQECSFVNAIFFCNTPSFFFFLNSLQCNFPPEYRFILKSGFVCRIYFERLNKQ